MLTDLRITNFAIIDSLNIELDPGFVIFTGETGAGKSIIIDAIETVLGNRADNTLIRTKADRAIIEADFNIEDLVDQHIKQILIREDLLDDEKNITLSRELKRNGRSIARINGRSVNIGLLREISNYLVDIHGQSEHLSLLNAKQQLNLLDRFADLLQVRVKYQEIYSRYSGSLKELEVVQEMDRDSARRTDLLRYQLDEIETANLKIGEEHILRQERDKISNSEGLIKICQEVLFIFDEGDVGTKSVSDQIGTIYDLLTNLSRLDISSDYLASQANAVNESLTDLINRIRNYYETIEFNPDRQQEIEERLDIIFSLKRKYGKNIEDVLKFAQSIRDELVTITNASERIGQLELKISKLLPALVSSAENLSALRKKAANQLDDQLGTHLQDLNMDGARFKVEFRYLSNDAGIVLKNGEKVSYYRNGIDNIEFLIETNPGEDFKPLAKIISGGESSRLMLAIKHVLAIADYTPTLVFDEIDQGVGGRVGAIVGQKLLELSRHHQVFCITHLPQLAAYGNQHFRVEKKVVRGRTVSNVKVLTDQDRHEELAHMLGEVSEATLQSAREILMQAKESKTSL